MKRCFAGLCCAGVAVLLAGCLSTPESRIGRNPELFATFPAEAQAKIRQGGIEVGFTRDMVKMAIGAPRFVHTRTTAAGVTEVWTYTGVTFSTTMQPADGSYLYRDRAGVIRRAYEPGWVDVQERREYPTLRVEFEGGKVKAIERLRQ